MELKARLARGELIDGVVVKTPSHQVIEVLAASGCPLVMLDAEHGQLDISALDAMLAVSNALGLDALVRVAAADRVAVQQALDAGATGVVVPHVTSPARASEVARWSHYGDGGRGYSGSTRSAGWGTRAIADVVATAASSTVVVVQVEDIAALGEADAIAATDGVDAVFAGAADLAVAMGRTATSDPDVDAAARQVIKSARTAGKAAAVYAGTDVEAEHWRAAGATVVFLGSDQSRLLR